jgi:site-specific DNA recombinase
MAPTHAIKKGARYRYYISRPLTNDARVNAPDAMRIPAGEIEWLVVARIDQFFSEPSRLIEILSQKVETAVQQRRLLQRAAELGANWPTLTAAQIRQLLTALIRRIVLGLDGVDIQLLPSRVGAVLQNKSSSGPIPVAATEPEEQPIVLSVPAQFRRAGLGIRLLVDGPPSAGQASKADPTLVKLIARAHHLSSKLAASSSEYLAEIAQAEGLTSS